MKRQAIRVLFAAAVGGFVLVAAGCGGSKSATPPGTTSKATTTEAAATTTAASTGVGALGGLLTSKNCGDLANLAVGFGQALSGAGTADLQKVADLVKQFADKTPADIRPDFEELASAYAKVAQALKGVDLSSGKVPTADVLARLAKLSTEVDQAKLTKASNRIQAWAKKNCTTK